MKAIVVAALLGIIATNSYAASCKSNAAERKLAGAALNSFMKKCEADAAKACAANSVTMKLAGAAKTSHTKKCVADAVGN